MVTTYPTIKCNFGRKNKKVKNKNKNKHAYMEEKKNSVSTDVRGFFIRIIVNQEARQS